MDDKQLSPFDLNRNKYLKYYSSLNLSSNIQLENTKYIILMSHGEKQIPHEKPPLIKNIDDTELSWIGIQQTLDIDNHLQLIFQKLIFLQVHLLEQFKQVYML